MLAKLMPVLAVVATVGSGVVAGVFFAFSSFVMPGLSRLPTAGGIAAMQSINVTAVTPLFMTALFGTALVCLIAAVGAALGWSYPGAVYIMAGSLIYLVCIIVVTAALNVPLNDALAAADPASGEGSALWTRYLAEWVRWNHVRTIGGIAAFGCFLAALR